MGCKLTKIEKYSPEMEDIFEMSNAQIWSNNWNSNWFLVNLILADLHFVCKVYELGDK